MNSVIVLKHPSKFANHMSMIKKCAHVPKPPFPPCPFEDYNVMTDEKEKGICILMRHTFACFILGKIDWIM